MKPSDLVLYLVTDRELAGERSLEWIVDEAIKGGVTMVQLREKLSNTRDFLNIAKRLMSRLQPMGIPLIINDRVDIALAIDADGLHLGQQDMPWEHARALLGPNKIIGLSIENIRDAIEANNMDIDYIALSPVFATPTKADTASPLGLHGIRSIRAVSRHPIVAIGGISLENVFDVMEAGADGVALVSAIITADQPRQAAQALKHLIVS